MITRFYVDNYKSLVNFEYKAKSFELILGSNGSGKSTLFEALALLQGFVLNEKRVDQAFPYSSLTRWQNRDEMRFEIGIADGEFDYRYELQLNVHEFGASIQSEVLWRDNKKLIESNLKMEVEENEWGGQFVNTFMQVDNQMGRKAQTYRSPSFDESILGRYETSFKEAIRKIIFLKIQPDLMSPILSSSERRPSPSFSNFPAYYLHLLQEKQNLIFDFLPVLRENIQGFRSFILEERGKDTRQLRIEFAVEGGTKGQTIRYNFDELSDGQRVLIALYTVAFCEPNSFLFVDEPENFISSRELQPWLMLLKERIEDFGGQAILISHHPEFINVMAPQDAIQFRRINGGPVQIRPFETEQYAGLTPAEIVARGWENE